MIEKCKELLAKPFFRDFRTLAGLWLLLGVLAAVMKMHSHNNFLVFRGSFWHAWQGLPLYAEYPQEYWDINHYGPLFSLLIAPFAVVPEWLGLLMWCVALSLGLYVAVRRSLLTSGQQLFVLWFCAHELLTALYMQQFNIAIAAIIVGAFFLIEKERDATAAFFIVLGTLVKIYGIVGLAFFFFSKHKIRFIGALVLWSAVMFVAPMVLSSPDYVIGQYQAWFVDLVSKNSENAEALMQNISLLGMTHRVTGLEFSDLWLILPGLVMFGIPYLRIIQYKHMAFRQTLLASVLMFTVLFSTGSENSTYIIAFAGVALWYASAPWQRSKWDIALMVVVFIISSLSPGDLFPKVIYREVIQPYALKALPVTIVWFKLCYEMYTRDYKPLTVNR